MRKVFWRRIMLLTLAVSLCLPTMGYAKLIGDGDFGAGAVIEGFEGMRPQDTGNPSNGIGPVEYYDNFTIGHGVITTFTSGVQFTAPLIPNGSMWNGGDPFLNENGTGNTWGANGNPAVGNIPDGKAWVGTFNPNYGNGERILEFTFPSLMLRTGGYVTGASGYNVTLTAFDKNGTSLESFSIPTVHVDNWKTNFIGIENATGIAKIQFSCVDMGVDKLTFEPVPLPGAVLLLGAGMVRLVAYARRREE